MKVSIITVVYNGAKTIEQTILSVIEQTYKNIEYIIIDGQSTDGTQKIIKKYLDFISVYISEKDNGIYDAMNKGIRRATGEIIGIINSDDWYDRNAINSIVQFFLENKVEVVYGKIILVHSDGKMELMDKVPLETIWYQMAVPHPSVFMKKEIYEKFGLFDLKYRLSADYDFLLRLYTKQVKFGFLDTVIAYFRAGGVSELQQSRGLEEHRKISMKYITKCARKNELLCELENWYSWTYLNIIINEKKENLSDLICKYFQTPLKEIAIFGTGIWGNKCYELLEHGFIKVKCFVDSNPHKWGKYFHDIKIINPRELYYENTYILIAVKLGGKEIKRQLTYLGNNQLKIICLEELKDIICN